MFENPIILAISITAYVTTGRQAKTAAFTRPIPLKSMIALNHPQIFLKISILIKRELCAFAKRPDQVQPVRAQLPWRVL
jgi:hypothetical protein